MTTKLLLTIPEACEQLSIGRSLFLKLVYGGAIESICIGTRRLIPEAALCEFIERQRGIK